MSDLKELVRAPENITRFNTLFARKNGSIAGINKKRQYETTFFLNTNPPNNNVAMLANKTSQSIAMRASGEGPMQLTQLGAVRDGSHGACLVRMYVRDGTGTIMLMNSPCHIDTMFGPGGQMYHLPEGLYLDEDRATSVMFTDLSGGDTNARIVGVGAKYTQIQNDPSLARIKERLRNYQFLSMPYFYTFDSGKRTLNALQALDAEIEISNAHNFEVHQLSFVSTGSFNIDIIDLTKGESIINGPANSHFPIPHLLLCGDGSYPYRFHEPVMVFGGQRLLIKLQDTSGAANDIYLTLGGRMIKIRMWS